MTALVCGQWEMPLPGSTTNPDHRWFYDWASHEPKQVSGHISCGYAMLQALRDYDPTARYESVTELFGGLGCQSLMVRNLFSPTLHTVHENHPAAAAHLRTFLTRPGEVVVEGDSYTVDLPRTDVFVADFGDLTARTAQAKHAPLLRKMLDQRPKAITLADISGPRMRFPSNRRSYERLLGVDCSTYDSYLRGLTRWFRDEYGYGTLALFYHHWSAAFVLVPDDTLLAEPQHAPSRPTGLILKEHS